MDVQLRDVMMKSVLSYSLWEDSLLSQKQLFTPYFRRVHDTGQSRHDTAFRPVQYSFERLPSGKDIGKFIEFSQPLWSH